MMLQHSLKHHFLSGYAKDLGSTATIVWLIFTGYIWYKWLKTQWDLYKQNKKSIFKDWKKVILIIIIGILSYPLTLYLLKVYRYLYNVRKS